MPELPEVQTIVNNLEKILPGLTFRDVWTDTPKLIKYPGTFPEFKKMILGKKVLSCKRRGKNILIHLSHNLTLLVHQKMTGHLMYGRWRLEVGSWKSREPGPLRDDPQNRFIRLLFTLSNKHQLALCDMRKFAKVILWKTSKLNELEDIKKLGPDPAHKNFTFKKFIEIMKNRKGKIKQALMDQSVVSGIGNIYADESLWGSGIHPVQKIQNLKEKHFKKLYGEIRSVLKAAIKAGGSSNIDFRNAHGERGKYQEVHGAYHLHGKKCQKNDGGIIKQIRLGGRSTHFCPAHQRLI